MKWNFPLRWNTRVIARTSLWFSGALNVFLVVIDIATRQYAAAATQSIFVVVVASWGYLMPKIDLWIDARLAEAMTQGRAAELVHAEVQRLVRVGELGLSMRVTATPSGRVN